MALLCVASLVTGFPLTHACVRFAVRGHAAKPIPDFNKARDLSYDQLKTAVIQKIHDLRIARDEARVAPQYIRSLARMPGISLFKSKGSRVKKTEDKLYVSITNAIKNLFNRVQTPPSAQHLAQIRFLQAFVEPDAPDAS